MDRRSLASYSSWGHKESDATEHLRIYTLALYLQLTPNVRLRTALPPLIVNAHPPNLDL